MKINRATPPGRPKGVLKNGKNFRKKRGTKKTGQNFFAFSMAGCALYELENRRAAKRRKNEHIPKKRKSLTLLVLAQLQFEK